MSKKSKKIENENVSEIEKELAKMKIENEQMKKVLEEKEKLLKKFQEVKANEKLTKNILKQENEFDDNTDDLDDINIPNDENINQSFKIDTDIIPKTPDNMVDDKKTKFDLLIENFGKNSQGYIEIYKIVDGVSAKITKIPVREYDADIDEIAKKYGGGKYELILRDDKGIIRGRTVEYYYEKAYNPNTNLQTPITDVSYILKSSTEQNEKMYNTMFQMMNNFVQTLASMLGQKTSLINSVRDIAEIQKMFKSDEKKSDGNNSVLKDFNTLIEVFKKGVSLGEISAQSQVVENSDNGDLLNSVLKMVIPNISKVSDNGGILKSIEKKLQSQQPILNNPPQQPILNNPPQQPILNNPPQEIKTEEKSIEQSLKENKEETVNNILFKYYKMSIIELAKKNEDVEKTAQLIISRIPDQYLLMAYDIANLPNRYEIAVEYIPELKDYKDWSEKVYEKGKEILYKLLV